MCALATEGVAFDHVHINPETKEWEGREVYGLVAPYKHRPDGVIRNAHTRAVERVFFYHGNRWHGYPPEHELYNTLIQINFKSDKEHWVNTKITYIKTMADMQRFKDRGYVVSYMWEHEHVAATRAKKPLLPVVRYL